MNLPVMKPTIIIKQLGENCYSWYLYLSPNKARPTCTAPIKYTEAYKCRESAKEFAQKLRGPIRLSDKIAKEDFIITDGVVIVDETRDKRKEPAKDI